MSNIALSIILMVLFIAIVFAINRTFRCACGGRYTDGSGPKWTGGAYKGLSCDQCGDKLE